MSFCSFTPDSPVVADQDWSDALASVCRIEGAGAAVRQARPCANDNDARLMRLPNRAGARLLSLLSEGWKGHT